MTAAEKRRRQRRRQLGARARTRFRGSAQKSARIRVRVREKISNGPSNIEYFSDKSAHLAETSPAAAPTASNRIGSHRHRDHHAIRCPSHPPRKRERGLFLKVRPCLQFHARACREVCSFWLPTLVHLLYFKCSATKHILRRRVSIGCLQKDRSFGLFYI